MRNMAPPGNVSSARKEGSPTLCQRRHRFAQCRLPRPQQTKAASCHCQPHDATATRSRSTSPVVGRIPPHSTRSLPIFGDRFFASVHWLSCPCFPVATSAPAVPSIRRRHRQTLTAKKQFPICLEGEVRRQHRAVDQRISGAQSQVLGIQHGRLGARGDRQAVAPFPTVYQ